MAVRVITRLSGSDSFITGAAHANTGIVAFQNDLRDALKDPNVTDIILMDDSKTDLTRFVPFLLRANGRP